MHALRSATALGLVVLASSLMSCAPEQMGRTTADPEQAAVAPATSRGEGSSSADEQQESLASALRAAAAAGASSEDRAADDTADTIGMEGMHAGSMPMHGMTDTMGMEGMPMESMPMGGMTGTMGMEGMPMESMPMRGMTGTMGMEGMPMESMPMPGMTGTTGGSATATTDASIARECMDLVAHLVLTDKVPPTAASRIYAYTSLALYEAAKWSDPEMPSIVERLTDGPLVPPPPAKLNWDVAAAAAISTVAKGLLTSDSSLKALDAELVTILGDTARPGVVPALLYGAEVGELILDWAADDGYAETRDRPYAIPQGEGKWMATSDAPPHEPYWGTLRPFALANADVCAPPPPPTHSMEEDSVFWRQVQEVYDTSQSLTDETRAIAEYWSDSPGTSYTPAGHWIEIVGIVTEDLHLSLADTSEAYAVASVAMADAFISTWSEKYRSNLIRPITVIQNHIDPDWESIVPTPPFPEYTSGHSVASAATAEVLTGLLGYVAFEDDTNVAHGMESRQFGSFRQAAEEAAMSRLYGGIHFRAAIEEGLKQGACVGQNLLATLGEHG